MRALLLAAISILAGCTASIADVDTRGSEPGCTRECSSYYSTCVGHQGVAGFTTWQTLSACHDGFAACVRTCPPKA